MTKWWTAPSLATVLLFSSTSWAQGSSHWDTFNNQPIGVWQDNECLFASWQAADPHDTTETDFFLGAETNNHAVGAYVHGQRKDNGSSFCGMEGMTIQPQTHYATDIGYCDTGWGVNWILGQISCDYLVGYGIPGLDITTKYNMITGGDFESETDATLSPIWHTEGNSAAVGADIHSIVGWEHSGYNNAWIHGTKGTGWNAITRQLLVGQGQEYYVTGWVNASDAVHDGYYGVRGSDGKTIYGQVQFGPTRGLYQRQRLTFRAPRTEVVTVFAGFWMPNQDAWIRVDDMWMTLTSAP